MYGRRAGEHPERVVPELKWPVLDTQEQALTNTSRTSGSAYGSTLEVEARDSLHAICHDPGSRSQMSAECILRVGRRSHALLDRLDCDGGWMQSTKQ